MSRSDATEHIAGIERCVSNYNRCSVVATQVVVGRQCSRVVEPLHMAQVIPWNDLLGTDRGARVYALIVDNNLSSYCHCDEGGGRDSDTDEDYSRCI